MSFGLWCCWCWVIRYCDKVGWYWWVWLVNYVSGGYDMLGLGIVERLEILDLLVGGSLGN